jgi:hypothetical protein
VSRMESVRVQLDSVARVASDPAITAAALNLHRRITELEMNLVYLRLTGQGQDGVRFGSKLLAKLVYLSSGLSSSDFRPTDQHIEVQGILNRELRGHLATLDVLLGRDLEAVNSVLRAKGMAAVAVRSR